MTDNNNEAGDKKDEEIKEQLNEEKIKDEEEIKEPLGDRISILHYMENPNIIDNMESPRSINAMLQLGYIMDDIRYLTFSDFINNNPSFRSLPKETQLKRYEFSEQYRYEKIQKIKEFRDLLIEHEKENINDKDIINNNINEGEEINENNIDNNINEGIGSTAINEELRQFERMKRKNEMDLMNAVEFELQRQIMIKEGEAKLRKQNIKNDNFRKSVELKNELEKKKMRKDKKEEKKKEGKRKKN